MSNTNTGGPAFPLFMATGYSGMNLRDYFAAKALQGMYASNTFPSGMMEDTASEAYAMADFMLQARNK